MKKIADHEVEGKTVLVRVDLNCPVENGKITSHIRISAHSKTIKELSDRGAKVVVLSHQGRKGRGDFINLEQHARVLGQILEREVRYVDDVVGKKALSAIRNLKEGDIIVLDNVRHLHCETNHPDGLGEIVYHLSPIADYFVLDALSVAHRKHSSVVGFSKKIPCFAGDILAAEVDALARIRGGRDVTFIFGGSKADDSFTIMEKWLGEGRTKHVLVAGALAVLMLRAKGFDIGDSAEYLSQAGLEDRIPSAKKLLDSYGEKILLPVDVGLSNDSVRTESPVGSKLKGEIWDIGKKTIEIYSRAIHESENIVMNGPAGVYEVPGFEIGTRAILEAVSGSKAFSLLGGGHTVAAIEKLGLRNDSFGYVSLSGKAMIAFLCGERLPGIDAIDKIKKSG